MKLVAGVTTVRGMRLAVAYADPGLLQPGPGDALLLRLGPWFPGLPIMLVSLAVKVPMAYASFDTRALLAELDLAGMPVHEIDLALRPPDPQDLPF